MLSNLESIQSNQSLQKLQKRPILDQNSSKKWHHSILSSMLIQLLTHLMVGIIHHVMSHNYNYNRIYLKGLECLHRQLSSQFKVLTKSHVHSTATGTKCDLFKNSPLGTKDTRKGIRDRQYDMDVRSRTLQSSDESRFMTQWVVYLWFVFCWSSNRLSNYLHRYLYMCYRRFDCFYRKFAFDRNLISYAFYRTYFGHLSSTGKDPILFNFYIFFSL